VAEMATEHKDHSLTERHRQLLENLAIAPHGSEVTANRWLGHRCRMRGLGSHSENLKAGLSVGRSGSGRSTGARRLLDEGWRIGACGSGWLAVLAESLLFVQLLSDEYRYDDSRRGHDSLERVR
jgi:hypothetical protein